MCSTGKPWQASCRSGLRDLLHRANTLPCAAGMEQKTIITTLTRKPILMSFRRSDRKFGLQKFSQCVTSVETHFMLWSFKESGSSLHFETSCTTEHGANLHPQAQLVASSVTPCGLPCHRQIVVLSDNTRFGAPTTTVTAFFTWTTTVAAWSGLRRVRSFVAFVVKNQMCLKFFQFDEICHGRSRSLLHYPGLVKPQRPNFSAETHLQKWRNDWNCARQMTPIPVATTPMLGAAFCEQPTWEVWHSEIWKLFFQISRIWICQDFAASSSVASRSPERFVSQAFTSFLNRKDSMPPTRSGSWSQPRHQNSMLLWMDTILNHLENINKYQISINIPWN